MSRLLPPFSPRCKHLPIQKNSQVSLSILPLENSSLTLGDSIQAGQPLVDDLGDNLLVHAPFSGTVENIILHQSRRYYYLKRSIEEASISYTAKDPLRQSAGELIRQLRIFGIEDNNGPLWQRVRAGRGKTHSIVVNGLEKEPYLWADTRILLEYSKEVLLGAEYLRSLMEAQEVIIVLPKGAESTKHIEKITKRINRFGIHETKLSYPKANDRFLSAEIFKPKKSWDDFSIFSGASFFCRPSTLLAVEEALLFHKPQIESVVTVDGAYCNEYGNFRLPIGTPFHYFLRPFSAIDSYVVINGGPLTGVLADPKKGIDKKTQAVLVFTPFISSDLKECSECGLCVDGCPCGLNPIRLFDMINHGEKERAELHGRSNCIGCNACSCVCPSFLPLGQAIAGWEEDFE